MLDFNTYYVLALYYRTYLVAVAGRAHVFLLRAQRSLFQNRVEI